MVKATTRLILVLASVSVSCLLAADPPKAAPNYRIGETATQDVVTPVALMVVDPDATEMLRQQEAPRIPIIYRFNPKTADEVELAFRTAIAEVRARFIDEMEKEFNARKLDATAVGTAQFQVLTAKFVGDNAGLPSSARLLAAWAQEQSDDAIMGPLTGRLRDAMSRYIRPEGLPSSIKSSSRARVVTVNPGDSVTLDLVDRQHDDVARGNMSTLAKMKTDLIASFPADEQATGRYLAGFLAENCVVDADLTKENRDKRTESLVSLNNYEAGQMVVKKGTVINARLKAALSQINEKLRAGQLQQQVAESQTQTKISGEKSRWLLMGMGGIVAVAGFVVWRVTAMRSRASRPGNPSNLPMKIVGAESDGMVISCPTCAEHIVVPFEGDPVSHCEHGSPDDWKQRALAAERRAEQAAAMVRAGMLSQMAKHLTTDVVQKLISERNQLVNEQAVAADGVEKLEQQLEQTEGNWSNQRKSYEQRIAELEKDLSESNELNRALIKTKIAIARRQLASADAAHKTTRWN